MKTTLTTTLFGRVYTSLLRGSVSKEQRREILSEYRRIMDRAKDIGSKNNLLSSYTMCACFIALNRVRRADPEDNYRIFAQGVRRSRILRMSLGNADSYLSEKRLLQRQKWSAETHEHRWENDWVVDILPPCAQYDLGYDYWACGVCKLCRDEGCPELAKYLCRLDFMLAEMIGLRLERTQTLAEGGDHCDFRFHRP